jgi:hypothetical protein
MKTFGFRTRGGGVKTRGVIHHFGVATFTEQSPESYLLPEMDICLAVKPCNLRYNNQS